MKTLSVKPVFVESKLDSEIGIYQGKAYYSSFGYTVDDWENYQLILISLDPNEKIEVGDIGYINIGGGTIGKISYDDKYHTWDLTTSDNIHYPFSTRDYIKKVIATHDQLSPDLINTLVAEYNNGGMRDFEIEMHNNLNDPERLYDFEEPYIPNGFVVVVDKHVFGVSDNPNINGVDYENTPIPDYPIVYIEEEVKALINKAIFDTVGNPMLITSELKINNVWFNKNKKK